MNTNRQSTRRSVLGSFAAGAVMLPSRLRALMRGLPPLAFVVVSDTHLGYRDQSSAAAQWERTSAEIAAAPGRFVLHLGDVVDGGREAQYPVYLDIRKKISKPVHEIPGNHDPSGLFAKYIREPIDAVVDYDWLRLLIMNNSRTDSHDGFLSGAQIEWMDRQCEEAAGQGRYVAMAMHVPAHTNRHPDRGWYVKPNDGQRALYELLAKRRDRVFALWHGHFHNGVRGWDDSDGLHEIAFPSALYNLDRRLGAQNAPGYNLSDFRPGFTLVTIASGRMKLEFKPVGSEPSATKELGVERLSS